MAGIEDGVADDHDPANRLRRIGELLCESSITRNEDDKVPSIERALAIADGDVARDLEIVWKALRDQSAAQVRDERAAHDAPAREAAQASWRIHRACEDAGFDAEAYVRAERRRRNRRPGEPPHVRLRPAIDAAIAGLDVEVTDVADALEVGPGAVVVELSCGSVDRTELWRRLTDAAPSTGVRPIFVAEFDLRDVGRADALLREAESLAGDELLRAREADRRTDEEVLQDPAPGAAPARAEGLCFPGYGAIDPALLLVPAATAHAALAHLGWEDGGSFTSSEHVAVARHLAEAYGAQVAAISFSTIEFVVASPPEGDALERATNDRLAYGDTTYGNDEIEPESVRVATARDLVWGFWFD